MKNKDEEINFTFKSTLKLKRKLSPVKKEMQAMNGNECSKSTSFGDNNCLLKRTYFKRIKMNNQNKSKQAYYHLKTEEVFRYIFYGVSNIINLFNVINYILQSYFDKMTDPGSAQISYVFSVIDLSFSCYYFFEFIAIKIKKRDLFNPRALLSFDTLIDIIAIVPSVITFCFAKSKAKPYLQILKVFRILKLHKSIKTLQYDTSFDNGVLSMSHIKLQLILIVAAFFCLFFIASGIVFNLQDIVPNLFNIEHLTFFDCVYLILITSTSVGYGDIVPTHIVSRCLILLLIVSFISLLSYQLSHLIQLFQLIGNYSKYSFKNHIICIIDHSIPLQIVLREIKREDSHHQVILITKDFETLPSTEYPYKKVYIINTSTIDLEVLERANTKDAKAIIVFGNTVFDSFESSEKVNEFIVLKIHQYYSSIPIYAQTLYNDQSFLNNIKRKNDEIFAFLDKGNDVNDDTIQKIVPIFKIKSLIISKALFNSGFATFAQNLIFNESSLPSDFNEYDMPMQAYLLGCQSTIKVIDIPHCFVHLEFYEVMRQIYSKSIKDYLTKVTIKDKKDANRPILLIGVIDPNEQNKILIFPNTMRIKRKMLGIVISYSLDNYIENVLKSFSMSNSNHTINSNDNNDRDDSDNDDDNNKANDNKDSNKKKSKFVRVETKRRKGFLEDSNKKTNRKKSLSKLLSFNLFSNSKIRLKEKENTNGSSTDRENNKVNMIADLNKIISNNKRKNSLGDLDLKACEEYHEQKKKIIELKNDNNNIMTQSSKLQGETSGENRKNFPEKSSNQNPYSILKYKSNAIDFQQYKSNHSSKKEVVASNPQSLVSRKKKSIKHSKTIAFNFNQKQKKKGKENIDQFIRGSEREKQQSLKLSIQQIKNNKNLIQKDQATLNKEFFVQKKNLMITGKDEIKDALTKQNILFLEQFDIDNFDKIQEELKQLAKRRYFKDEQFESDFVVDNRIFDVAKDNISEIIADHILFVGYQDGLYKMIKMVKLHYPYRDVCIMINPLFDEKIIMKYLKEFKGLYFLKGEVDNPIHLINSGIAKAAYVVFLIETIDNKKNEDMGKILGFRAIDYFFQTNSLLELWNSESAFLLSSKPLSRSSSVMNNPYYHPLFIAGKLLYVDQLNRLICMSRKNKLQIEAWVELLNVGYKTNSSFDGDTIKLQNESSSFPVLLTVDLPKEYSGKEFYNLFIDMICQKNPILILGVYVLKPLEYMKLRSEGRINKLMKNTTNRLSIVTSHKKQLINMNAFDQCEQDFIANLKTLKEASYNDKILLDYIDLRHPLLPIFITNPPPWFILCEDIQLLVLYYNTTDKIGDLTSFQRKYARMNKMANPKDVFGTAIAHQNRVVLNQRQENFYQTMNVFKEKIQLQYTEAYKKIEKEATRQKREFGSVQYKKTNI